jgi:ABC-type polysaccharide/polyol phosphate transport system ATPase subunit
MSNVISVRGVSKSFHHGRRGLLREQLLAWFSSSRRRNPFYALRNVSFDVRRGESVGVVGANGSGKSTLLSLVCGLTTPDTGTVHIDGRIAALLDLGSALHFDLTGAENLRLNASLLGLSRARTDMLFDKIVEFSELRDFIDEPLRTYSTGMVMRLSFSVAMHLDPDVLIVDEVLAVGDAAFQQKCFDKMMSFRRAGHTLLVVSHSGATLREICSRAIWLDHGNLMEDGEVNAVLDLYEERRVQASIG